MKLNKYILLTALCCIFCFHVYPQNILQSKEYPQDFRQPLDLSPVLAGSFGEIRSNHFHSGLDYRTNQREGYPVYATSDGFISRLRVQLGGFGNAVYISHPNGYTSVYAHLQRFNVRIGQVVKDFQYRRESFDVDFPLTSIEIPVNKGDIIGWSGNTGGSAGPHLHFELRDSKTEETINPQLFGLNVPDNVKPILTGLYMYRLNGFPFAENTPNQYFQITGADGTYTLNQSLVINFNGEIAFGISAYDQQIRGGNKNGIYSIELFLDDTIIYTSTMERFAFADSRAINSYIDYPALLSYGRTIQKSFIESGNPLTLYTGTVNKGVINLTDDEVHELSYRVKDIKGNTSNLTFRVKRNPKAVIMPAKNSGQKTFSYVDSNLFNSDRLKIIIPKGALYSDINFKYAIGSKSSNSYSAIHHIHTRLIPLHKNYQLWIKPDVAITGYLKEKAVIVDSRGIYQGGVWDNGFLKGSPKTFGSFYIRL
ncbi:MAG: M23 family metallopeptidase, partial [Gloeobacteraceae cyanobacterium ES-bin-316]|nr:M23 family metallopeptidase [Ferruginibacter sp.]